MPTYEYACKACKHRFEELQSFSEAPLKKCPKCKKKKLQRLIGAGAAIVFKGSGFYQTDYRSDSYKQRAEADTPPSEAKAGESKSTESRGSESKSNESKTENKSSEVKSGGDGGAAKQEKKSKRDE